MLHVLWQPNTTRGMSLGSIKLPTGLGPLKFNAGSTINMTVTTGTVRVGLSSWIGIKFYSNVAVWRSCSRTS